MEVLFVLVGLGLFVLQIARKSAGGRRRRRHYIHPAPQKTSASSPWASISEETQIHKLEGRCYVVDGDTITIDNVSIRLGGIDAPELDDPYGKKAKWTLYELTRGQKIRAEITQGDHYGRAVGTCYLPDGTDLAAEMVRRGMAIDWRKHSGGKYRQYETPDARQKLWRCVARQEGRLAPAKDD